MAATTTISMKFEDANGNTISIPFHFDKAELNTVTEAYNVASELAGYIGGVIGVALAEMSVSFDLDLTQAEIASPGISTPNVGYRVNSGGTLSFKNEADVAESIYIPGILDDFITKKSVDNAGAMATLTAAIAAGIEVSGTTYRLQDRNGLDLESFTRGISTTRKV